MVLNSIQFNIFQSNFHPINIQHFFSPIFTPIQSIQSNFNPIQPIRCRQLLLKMMMMNEKLFYGLHFAIHCKSVNSSSLFFLILSTVSASISYLFFQNTIGQILAVFI